MPRILLAVLWPATFLLLSQETNAPSKLRPPVTPRHDVTEVLHGVTVTDPYRWLEDQNSPETRKWIDAQNAYTHAFLDRWSGREAIEKRLTQLQKVEVIQSPIERAGRFFFRKRSPDQEQSVIYLRQGEASADQVLIDPNPMSADHSTNADIADVSKDGKVLAYLIRLGGKDESEVHLYDVDARHDLADRLPPATYFDVSFLPDRSGFYYSTMADAGPRVRFHRMGTETGNDQEVFGKGYAKEAVVVGDPSEDGRNLIVQVLYGSAADKVEIWTQDLTKKGPFEL